jgi:acyl carrier protein
MTGHLGEGDRRRAGGLGAALSPEQGLALLDAARGRDQAVLVAANLDTATLRALASAQAAAEAGVPPLLRGLMRAPARAAGDGVAAGGLAGRLAGLGEAEQEQVVLEVVRAQAASVLGHASAEAMPPGAVFRELGFDSLTAIELRNRMGVVTGLRLPATLVFDYPTPVALAGHLRAVITQDGAANTQDGAAAPLSLLAEIEKLESLLSTVTAGDAESAMISARLESVISKWKEARGLTGEMVVAEKLELSTDDEVFDFIEKELGIS